MIVIALITGLIGITMNLIYDSTIGKIPGIGTSAEIRTYAILIVICLLIAILPSLNGALCAV